VGAADLFPVLDADDEHAGAVDVLEGGSGFFEGCLDDGQRCAGLVGGRGVFGAYGAGAGDVNVVAEAHGSGEADDGLEGAGAWDVGARHRSSHGTILTRHAEWFCGGCFV
jgi:hypothetical protein